MTHPWDDLEEVKLEEMVEFCRKLFVGYKTEPLVKYGGKGREVIGNEFRVKGAIQWTWKKGDWAFFKGEIVLVTGAGHGYITYTRPGISITHVDSRTDYGWRDAVPLPLVHQWMELYVQLEDTVVSEITLLDGIWEFWGNEHKNPHIVGYLTFMKVVIESKLTPSQKQIRIAHHSVTDELIDEPDKLDELKREYLEGR